MEFQSKCGDCEAMANLQHKCVECGVSLCNKCKKRHGKKSGLSKHTVVKKETPKPVKRNVCRDHTPNEYQMFCDEIECQVPVCLTCISNTHKKHQFIELKEAEKKKKELFETMKEDLITKQLAHLSKTLKDIKRNREIHAAGTTLIQCLSHSDGTSLLLYLYFCHTCSLCHVVLVPYEKIDSSVLFHVSCCVMAATLSK